MIKAAARKLKKTAGASLAETLAAVLIMSMVMLAIGGGATVAKRVYRDVRLKADAQVLLATTVSAVSGEVIHAENLTLNDETISYYSTKHRCLVEMKNENDTETAKGVYLVNLSLEEEESAPLLTEQTSTLGLYSNVVFTSCEDDLVTFDVYVYDSEGKEMDTQEVVIHSSSE